MLAVAAAVLALVAPGDLTSNPITRSGDVSYVASVDGTTARITPSPNGATTASTYTLTRSGSEVHDGVAVDRYTDETNGTATGQPSTLTFERIAELNGGNLPIGVKASPGGSLAATYTDRVMTSALLDRRTSRVISLRSVETVTATVTDPNRGTFVLPQPVSSDTVALGATAVADASAAARADQDAVDHRALVIGLAWTSGVLALITLLAGLGLAFTPTGRRRRTVPAPSRDVDLVKS